jgi:hypothetical protein
LHNTALEYGEKHPIILPKHCISEFLIDAHRATLHGGPQLTLRTLREEYWVIGGRGLVKKHIRRCVICAHQAAKLPTQLMGNLPEPCVNLSPPFFHTDIDYAGPFGILPFVGRGQRKHYIALFICLATKTIHLEIVEDYTTAGFLAAFRRFVSRRDLTAHMYSGNGPNFHGADREVQTSFQAIRTDSTLQASLANDGVQWHFIPSAAPHFGRFWEAGVKSLKFHLR